MYSSIYAPAFLPPSYVCIYISCVYLYTETEACTHRCVLAPAAVVYVMTSACRSTCHALSCWLVDTIFCSRFGCYWTGTNKNWNEHPEDTTRKLFPRQPNIFRGGMWSSSSLFIVSDSDASSPCFCTWVVVKIMVPCWVPIIIRQLLFRVPKKVP